VVWVKYFYPEEDFNYEDYSAFKKIGIDTSAKFLCLFVQNKLQSKNADRKSAHVSGKYKNPWDEEQAKLYLVNVYKNVICTNMTKKLKKAKKTVQVDGSDLTTTFLTTDDLETAAAILEGTGLTLGTWNYMQDLIRDENYPKVFLKEKMLMIRDKEYNGKPLKIEFTLRKRFVRKTFKRVLQDYSYNEWKEIWFK